MKQLDLKYFLFILAVFVCQFNKAQTVKYSPDPDWYKLYDVKFYYINLDVTDTSSYIKGFTRIDLDMLIHSDSLVFDFNPSLTVDSVYQNGQRIKTHYFSGNLMILKNSGMDTGSKQSVTVYYKGNANSGSFFSSFVNARDSYWNIPITWTLSEPFGAKVWFPCKQQLADKADSSWIFVTVPKGRKAGSTGVLTNISEVSGKQRFEWKSRFPIAYYLLSFTVADYYDYTYYTKLKGRTDSIRVQNYIYNRPGYLENYKREIDYTADFLKLYSDLFGLYPFYSEKYGHCVAPIGGGMEHQTMTTLTNFGFSLVCHELMHQWFGDMVTCSNWQDIWINEGFASYGEYLAYEFLQSKDAATGWLLSAQNRALNEPYGSVFVPAGLATDENRLFSSNLSYKKGAVIIHTLRYVINNDSLFFRAMRNYLNEFKFKTASGDDFRKSVEKTTGLNLADFFQQWYYGEGYPQFDISWKRSKDSVFFSIQQTPSSSKIDFFRTPVDIRLTGSSLDTIIRLNVNSNPFQASVKISGPVSNISFDPNYCLLKKVTNLNLLPDLPSIDDYFTVIPNPFKDNLQLYFKNETSKDDQLKIVNISGSVVYQTSLRKRKDLLIDTEYFKPGIYLLYVMHGSNKYVRKIVKPSI